MKKPIQYLGVAVGLTILVLAVGVVFEDEIAAVATSEPLIAEVEVQAEVVVDKFCSVCDYELGTQLVTHAWCRSKPVDWPTTPTEEKPSKPQPSDFEVLSFKEFIWPAGMEGDSFWFIGEVKNVGNMAGDPVLQVTGYDNYGELLDVDDNHLKGWDMVPGETITFKIISIKRAGVDSYTYKIDRISVWGRTN